jgi:hypothetical protein
MLAYRDWIAEHVNAAQQKMVTYIYFIAHRRVTCVPLCLDWKIYMYEYCWNSAFEWKVVKSMTYWAMCIERRCDSM